MPLAQPAAPVASHASQICRRGGAATIGRRSLIGSWDGPVLATGSQAEPPAAKAPTTTKRSEARNALVPLLVFGTQSPNSDHTSRLAPCFGSARQVEPTDDQQENESLHRPPPGKRRD